MRVFISNLFRFVEVLGQGIKWHLDMKHMSEDISYIQKKMRLRTEGMSIKLEGLLNPFRKDNL
jgi:hypothetical protein